MKISENLRARAAYIAEHGWSHDRGTIDGPRCFCGADPVEPLTGRMNNDADSFLCRTVLACDDFAFSTGKLEKEGWNTADAVAALEMAADIAECEGL